jgi:fructose-specific phosphotransferase system IIC component
MDYLLGGSLGGLVAFFLAIPAIVLEINQSGRVKNAPVLVDVKTIFGLKIRHRHEVFFIGLLLHLVTGFLFGLVYIVFVHQKWLFVTQSPYTFSSIIIYALLSWVVAGTVLYPLLRMGWFGLKEGRYVWMETIISHVVIGLGLWLLIQYYQPFFFNLPM